MLCIPDVELTPTSSSDNKKSDSINFPGLPNTFELLDDMVLSDEENTKYSSEHEESNIKEDSL